MKRVRLHKKEWKKRWIMAFAGLLAMIMLFTGCGLQKAPKAGLENGNAGQAANPTTGVSSQANPGKKEGSGYLTAEEAAPENAQAVMDIEAEYDSTMMIYDGEILQKEDWNTEEYSYQKENSFQSSQASPFSTFAADVDTASYANIRRMALSGNVIPKDAVRIEELINYFHYDYPEPEGKEPFSVTTRIVDCPWNKQTKVFAVGLQAAKVDTKEMPASNLVFLIDVSGSMDEPNKLPLVKRSFMTLVENLSGNDRISIITYSSGEDIVAEGVSGEEKAAIMDALEALEASGATDGEHALEMAYEIAEENMIEGGNNRIILATDGDFNVGITSEGDLARLVSQKAQKGIELSVLGYGMGNYKDNKMEAMADNGNGNYYYIDDIAEARKVLVEEAGGTLFTVAKDVKLQVEFNPAKVKGYRLIGYENRTMAAEDFSDDSKDGGEIGAGHQVTALYEIVMSDSDFEIPEVDSKYNTAPQETSDEWLTLNIRYKEPEGTESILLEYPVDDTSYCDSMPADLSWALGVAQTGMLLSDSEYAGTSDLKEIRDRLQEIADDDYKEEFVYMLKKLQQ